MSDPYENWQRGAAKHAANCAQRRLECLEIDATPPKPQRSQVVYKSYTHTTSQPVAEPSQMSAEASRNWNAWLHDTLDAYERDRILPIFEAVAEELGAKAGKAAREQDERIKRLEDEIAALRCDLQVAQSITRNVVATFPKMRRRDAA